MNGPALRRPREAKWAADYLVCLLAVASTAGCIRSLGTGLPDGPLVDMAVDAGGDQRLVQDLALPDLPAPDLGGPDTVVALDLPAPPDLVQWPDTKPCTTGCTQTCPPGSTTPCLFTCPGGVCQQRCHTDCTMECGGCCCVQQCYGATCKMTCNGGHCVQRCLNNATCTITCPGGNCSKQCTTGSTCL